MVTAARWRPKVKPRPKPEAPIEVEIPRCDKCKRILDPLKYHDCGEQLELPINMGPEKEQ